MSTTLEENARLTAVHSYGLLDAARPGVLDELTGLAASMFETPISTVTLIDRHRQWFAGNTGMADDQGPRDISFCAQMVADPRMLVVPDATRHPVFRQWANVLGAPGIRFYAGAPLIDADGFVLGSVCVIDNEPRTVGDRRLDLLTGLAGQAAGHLGAIRDRLRHAVLDAELARAIEREEDIVAAISHELRTPVSTIRGYLEMLESEPELQPFRRLIEPIHRNGERLVSMVDHLLAGTRPPDVPMPGAGIPLELASVAAAAVEAVQPLAQQRGTRITVDETGGRREVRGDFPGLRRAAEQLVRNAVLFSPTGGAVRIQVSSGDRPAIEVADQGAGIPGHELSFVTQRFYRGRYAREQAVPGVGLGLHIAQQVAVAHHGSVSIVSDGPGRGTVARLSLPGATAREAA